MRVAWAWKYRPRVAAFACAAGLGGCDAYSGSTPGEDGVLNFYEPNKYPGDKPLDATGFERPIALGARVDVWTTGPGLTSLERVEIDRPEVLSIEGRTYPIVLRARSVGTATLRVTLANGATDSILLTVVAADGVRLHIPVSSPLLGPSDTSFGRGYALRPGATVSVVAEPTTGGEPLLGFDFLQWSADEALVSHDSDSTEVNVERFLALGTAGIVRVSTQLGGEAEFATLADSDVPQLQAHRVEDDLTTLVALTAIAPRDLDMFALTAVDSAGRLVRPAPRDATTFGATVTEGTVRVLEATMTGHYVTVRACAGTGQLELRYLGATLTLPLEVTADAADAECP